MENLIRYLHKKTTNTWLSLTLSLSLIFLLWLRANPDLFIFGESYLSSWRYTHYLFSYESGFVKRGLIGELLSVLSIKPSYSTINYIAYSSVFILIFAVFFILKKLWDTNKNNYGFFLLLLFITTSPATLQHFFYDVGRFDIYIYTGVIALLYILDSVSTITKFLTVNLFLSLFILIHEAAFFIVAPMIFMYWYYKDSSKQSLALQIISFFFIFFLTYLVATNGDYTSLPLQAHVKKLVSNYGGKVVENSVAVIHKSDLQYNIYMTFERSFTLKRLLHHLIFLLCMLPSAYLLFGLYKKASQRITLEIKILLLSGMSPLALYPLGYDHFRWWSLAITNIMLIILFLCLNDKNISTMVFKYFEDKRKLVNLIIMLGFILGPLRVMTSFLFAENFI
ncbi:hypothetical protein [Psychrobacter aquimaris]|uniref:hypothetical protein n=1 Tax=Psychrobacter aquimaris TaxID=292733 RepID=UPI0039C657D0